MHRWLVHLAKDQLVILQFAPFHPAIVVTLYFQMNDRALIESGDKIRPAHANAGKFNRQHFGWRLQAQYTPQTRHSGLQ
ncbi:MAG TPA: hypothetical protein VGB07_05040 [Blastocatellia bacterium]